MNQHYQEMPSVPGAINILSITAQKPHSTGSGVYLTEIVKALHRQGCRQAVLAGICREDSVSFPEDVLFYPVHYQSPQLPFPICGMSDEMPYESTRYQDMTPGMTEQFLNSFRTVLTRALDEFKPDLIICHHLYLLTALAREMVPDENHPNTAHTRIVGICHGSDLRQFKKNPLNRDYIRKQIGCLDTIWCLHKEQKQEIIRLFGCSPEKVRILGTGYNSLIFKKSETTQAEASNAKSGQILMPGNVRLVFAGKLSEKKGVKSLLRALRLLPAELAKRLSLTLAGGWGNQQEFQEILQLADQTQGCPCPVAFPGRLTQLELAQLMNQSDLFILPSFYEGLPLVLIEALACGLRPVCTDLPGIRPWMDENVPDHGIIFVKPPAMENEDEPIPSSLPSFEHDLAKAIVQASESIVSSDAGRNRLEKNLQHLSWDGLCKKLLDDYKLKSVSEIADVI